MEKGVIRKAEIAQEKREQARETRFNLTNSRE